MVAQTKAEARGTQVENPGDKPAVDKPDKASPGRTKLHPSINAKRARGW